VQAVQAEITLLKQFALDKVAHIQYVQAGLGDVKNHTHVQQVWDADHT
jgi:hypothetical protein